MKDGVFIFDNVVHMYDNTEKNRGLPAVDKILHNLYGFARIASTPQYPAKPGWDQEELTVEDAHRMLFEESETDIAMAQTVPQFGFWKNAFSPAEANYRLKEAHPDRVLFCGGVDPAWHGVEGAVRELERQVTEWGAVSMKFYQAHSNGLSWRIDDRKVAYPMWEKCLELGINNVQFHKGSPFGFEPMEALMPYDIQQAALDFPELTFIIHHLGDPYIDESISIAGRNENVWMALSALVNVYPVMPREFWMRFGKCLAFVGPEKLLYGSEAFIWPNVQGYIDIMMNAQMPEDLQDGYGFPEVTDEMRRMIMGENFARLLGIDVGAKIQELYGEPAPAGAGT